ncbi:hypothetical protein NIES4102_06250 [Chondrocystis sp. NIES-4102]|nr:hypothetical protein NIES4102_06250 [Chondrocystis sp. NIES-4102]
MEKSKNNTFPILLLILHRKAVIAGFAVKRRSTDDSGCIYTTKQKYQWQELIGNLGKAQAANWQ